MAQSASQIIDAKGGPSVFATAIGVKADAVRAMKHRNKLPRSVWPEIMGAFPDLTLEKLKASEMAAGLREARAA